MSGARVAIRMRDSNSATLKAFRGLQWYPIDDTYRVTARLIPYPEPKPLDAPNIMGDIEHYTAPGLLAFGAILGAALPTIVDAAESRVPRTM